MWWAPTSMTKNGLFVLCGPETQLQDILWTVHNGKNRARSEGEENIGVFPVTVRGRGRAMHGGLRFSCTRTRVGARRWALTEPERGIRLLNPSDCTAGYALLNLSDRLMAVN